jgi:large subunit ribosomal protein L31e
MAEPKAKPDVKQENVELSREYIIPLRRRMMTVPRYRRAKKAIRVIKEFLAKHMRVEDRDIRDVKINKWLNNEVWFRGIKNPPIKIKVKAVKKDGIVYAELAEIPEAVKFKMQKEEKSLKVDEKALKEIAKKEEEEAQARTGSEEKKTEESEKEKATVDAGIKEQNKEAKEAKHEARPKKPKDAEIRRQVMKR